MSEKIATEDVVVMMESHNQEAVSLTICMAKWLNLIEDCKRCGIDIVVLLQKAGVQVTVESDPEPMSQEEVENWILLKGQNPDERWFEIRILDDKVGQDPTAKRLMAIVSDMIFKGIHDMPFIESQVTSNKNRSPNGG